MNRRQVMALAMAVPVFVASPSALACVGDCSSDRKVTVDELVTGVNIALGNLTLNQCPAFNCNGDGKVTVDCLVKAVNNALNGCPAEPSPTPTNTPTVIPPTTSPLPTTTIIAGGTDSGSPGDALAAAIAAGADEGSGAARADLAGGRAVAGFALLLLGCAVKAVHSHSDGTS